MEGTIESFDGQTITTPVQRFFADQILHGLGGHRSLHGMEIWAVRTELIHTHVAVHVDGLHGAAWVAKIPRQTIHSGINVTGRTRDLTPSRVQMGVVHVRTTLLNFIRNWVKQ